MKAKDPPQTAEDAEIEARLACAKQGDRAAQDRLFDRYRPAGRAAPRAAPSGRHERLGRRAGGAAQGHAAHRRQGGGSCPELESWLQRILKNTIVQGFRDVTRKKRDAHQAVSLDDPDLPEPAAEGRTPSQAVARGAEEACLDEAVAAFLQAPDPAAFLAEHRGPCARELRAFLSATEALQRAAAALRPP